jgi:RNA polymerase sigma factor (sigma-70 family)
VQDTTTAAVHESALPMVADAEPSLADLDDADLLALARRDHDEAYAALFTRHAYAAHRLARHLGHREEAEDIVADAFAQVLDLLRRGKGPDRAFRAYLFTTIRHEAGRRALARRRVTPTDDMRRIDSVVPFGDGRLEDFEQAAIRGAYESLPDRWRTVLWHLDVEGRKPQELALMLKMSPNSVSALAYRARSALREAYLRQHVNPAWPTPSEDCRKVRARLSAFVRGTAPGREYTQVGAHLASCSDCVEVYAHLQEINREVGTITATVSAVVSVLGLTAAGAWSWLSGQVLAFGKAAAASVAAPATVAVVTAATVVGVTGSDVVDPPRHPMTVRAEEPHANRPRVASAADSSTTRHPAASDQSTSSTRAGDAAGSSSGGTPTTAAGSTNTDPPEEPTRAPAVSVRTADALIASIASITTEISSRLLASALSQGTTN